MAKKKKHKHREGQKFIRKWIHDTMIITSLNYNSEGVLCYELNNGEYKYTESILENEILKTI